MAEKEKLLAPYNFVPFSNKVLLPYQSAEELPAHDELRPDLLTGEIRVSFRAETPVFVSDGNKNEPHFFRGPEGKYQIPGSSVRGLLRENMQILGFGLVRPGEDLEDYQIYFRAIASQRGSSTKELQEIYKDILSIESRKSPEGKSYSIPRNVESGWLYCRNGTYSIYPTQKPVIRVPRDFEDVIPFGDQSARVISVAFSAAGDRARKIVPAENREAGMETGALLYTGKPVHQKKHHLYLFSEPCLDAQCVTLSEEDVLSFKKDYENKENSLRGLQKHSGVNDCDKTKRDLKEWLGFWQLPPEGERKPVFFLRYDSHIYFGFSRYLRVGYRHSISEGLPDRHRENAALPCPLDYPHAILGFAGTQTAYRSRVSVSPFVAEGSPKELPAVNAILAGPKPSWFAAYVKEGKNYHEGAEKAAFQLSGYKQYWLKDVRETSADSEKKLVQSTLRPLPVGTVFRGTVRFRNLKREELGLLLWCLRLEQGCYQSIGMGKPLGYGRLSVTLEELRLLSPDRLYSGSLNQNPWKVETDQISEYISAYNQLAGNNRKKGKASASARDELQDFFYIRSSLRGQDEADYLALGEYGSLMERFPTLKELRNQEEAEQKQPDKHPQSMEDMLAMWKNKNKGL